MIVILGINLIVDSVHIIYEEQATLVRQCET